jgi:KDO2-lipid IV(A) lauroyltransferase
MKVKQIKKSFAYASGYVALNFCSLITKMLPRGWLYGFAGFIAVFGYHAAAKQRNIALDSLRLAFGKLKSEAEVKGIARECFVHMAKAAVELLFLMDRPLQLKSRVRLEGAENLTQALKKGHGVILVSAHFGNFPLMLAKLSLEGYRVSGIMRQMKDTRVEKLFLAKRNRLGIRTIYSQPRRACVEETIRNLRQNELVFIPIDQNFGTAGVFVDFFGRKAATATGPVVLAQRTGAAILPVFSIRQSDDTHKIVFEPPLQLLKGAGEEETLQQNIQKLTSIIEEYIRTYPAEWGWIHRRWKSQPQVNA